MSFDSKYLGHGDDEEGRYHSNHSLLIQDLESLNWVGVALPPAQPYSVCKLLTLHKDLA